MYKCILHATDLQENHLNFCEQSYALSKTLNADFYLLHILNTPDSWQFAQGLGFAVNNPAPIEDTQLVMNVLGEQFNLKKHQLIIKQGSIKNCLLETIDIIQADLVIIGAAHSHFIQGEFIHLTNSISQQGICDVLIMHEK